MQFYCQCGYPIRVTTYWNGHEYGLYLYDGYEVVGARGGPPIAQCPDCGRALALNQLRQSPESLEYCRVDYEPHGEERVS